jgi:phage shock protein E
MSDYDERAKEYGFASKESIAKALKEPKTVLLDVRRQDEIDENGAFKMKSHPWVQSSCTPTECPDLKARANELLPDKDGTFRVLSRLGSCPQNSLVSRNGCHALTAPVVVYCRSGRRAARAEKTLKDMGYKTVMNAGAKEDLASIKTGQNCVVL